MESYDRLSVASQMISIAHMSKITHMCNLQATRTRIHAGNLKVTIAHVNLQWIMSTNVEGNKPMNQ